MRFLHNVRYTCAYGDKYGTGLCVESFHTWRKYRTSMYGVQYVYLHVRYGVRNYEHGNFFDCYCSSVNVKDSRDFLRD